MPASTWPTRPATRTMKNSSRLSAEIERKRSRSSRGWLRLLDSSSTRRLNSSHDNSRLMKRSGEDSRPDAAPSNGTIAVFMPGDLLLTVLTTRRPNSASSWE